MSSLTAINFLSPAFLEEMLWPLASGKAASVLAVEPLALDNSASILVALTAGQCAQTIGHFGLTVTLEIGGQTQQHAMVLKVKPHGREISAMLGSLAQACGGELADVYPAFATRTGFQHTHQRELAVYQLPAAGLMPRIWGTYINEEAEIYCVLMEYLQEVTLLNSVLAPHTWTDLHLRTALNQMAHWHARHLITTAAHQSQWPDQPSKAYMQELTPLWSALLTNATTHFPDLYTPSRTALLRTAIQQIPGYWAWQEKQLRTLVHNDLNPRNTCFRNQGDELQLCAYDWELATYHVPVYDVVELLCFVLAEDRYHLRLTYLEHYRQALHHHTGRYADAEAFRREASYAALDFGLHRLGLYLMAHTVSPYPFLPRVVNSYFDTLAQLQPLG
ncbi:phosphotransferase [Hymenobacter sp.]|jgi:hypothetical protein|uniref:phosphotransferase n=1 Tax=Hymenobacter sp. TaxID=1898978 RepID=UPI002EDA09AF